jgi:thiamine transport system permease protein
VTARREWPHPGGVVALLLLGLVGGAFAALLTAAGDRPALLSIGPYLLRILAFSLAQASLSTALSLILGTAIALALARRRFKGREVVLAALGAAAVMPAIVVVFSILTVYGRNGWVAHTLRAAGVEATGSIFGWPGILLAHVFLNAPFAARVMVNALAATPAEHWRLAESLGFTPGQVFKYLDRPLLRAELPGLAGLIFLLCFTSFAIVLSLGGGPSRATLEVAIYEALKLDLDFARAAWLAFVQVAICLSLAAVLHWAIERNPLGTTLRAPIDRPDAGDRRLIALDCLVLALGGSLVLPILLAVLPGLRHLSRVVERDLALALATSLAIAIAAASIACALATALAAAVRFHRIEKRRSRQAALYDFLPSTLLSVPPFALTAGLYLVLRAIVEPSAAGYVLLPLINGLGALPFAYGFLRSPMIHSGERYGRLCALLGLQGLGRLRIVDWPLLRRPLAAAFAMAMALSFGDFGVVALFGGTELRTLPYLLYERLGAYRIEEASAIGCIIVMVSFLLSYLSGRFAHADD